MFTATDLKEMVESGEDYGFWAQGEEILPIISAHFSRCEECRADFDVLEYDFEQFKSIFESKPTLSEWICEKD